MVDQSERPINHEAEPTPGPRIRVPRRPDRIPSTVADDRPAGRPNILWILSEDASPHIGCYGETAIETPRLDRLAREGVRFSNAFVTCPVCSPSRSALIAGMYQTTFGSHNHRSCSDDPKAGGNRAYYESYRVPESLHLIPELFFKAGYAVVNGGKGKEDYNFIARNEPYSGEDWRKRTPGQPFFAQIQLHGGKDRNAQACPSHGPRTGRSAAVLSRRSRDPPGLGELSR